MNESFNSPPPFRSPGFSTDYRAMSPQHQRFVGPGSPAFASPRSYNFSPPFQCQPYQSTPVRFNNRGSPRPWHNRNKSFGTNSSSGSYRSDRSFGSPYDKSNRSKSWNSRSRNTGSSGSNPGHSGNISMYYNPTMLEDPWKGLMEKIEKETENPKEN